LPKQIVIKKYSNRRLYDTTHKTYVTLEDIAALIREGHEVKVIDSQTEEDITKVVLIQVIWEGEKNKQDILPTSFLHMLIKYGNQIAREFFENYFLMMFQPYLSFQERKMPPLLKMPEQAGAEHGTEGEDSSKTGSPAREDSTQHSEIEELKHRIKELEDKIESINRQKTADKSKTETA
jgi:polyhydroxyalkanoate synthesis repressor PhaR